jgi:uncharacterized LabA/DUF88 family protein
MVRPAAPTGSGSWGFYLLEGNNMPSVCVYIDGFNLYHALRKFKDGKVKWLNLNSLVRRLLMPKSEQLNTIYYFSAYARWLPAQCIRHEEYVKALQTTGIQTIMGHFKEKDRYCNHCHQTTKGHEEKETDVSIGITLLNDAYKNRYDRALLISRDSDLVPAVKMVKAEFPNKEIVAVAPPMMGHSNDLIRVCDLKRKIRPDHVRACLFPREVLGPDGKTIAATRPKEYD